MRHSYKKIVAYNPVKNVVTGCALVPAEMLFRSKAVEKLFWQVYNEANMGENLIIGVGITDELYQIAPTSYDKYIKEDNTTIKHINRSKFLVACAKYQRENNLWSSDY